LARKERTGFRPFCGVDRDREKLGVSLAPFDFPLNLTRLRLIDAGDISRRTTPTASASEADSNISIKFHSQLTPMKSFEHISTMPSASADLALPSPPQ
jgi:hypothetical protein